MFVFSVLNVQLVPCPGQWLGYENVELGRCHSVFSTCRRTAPPISIGLVFGAQPWEKRLRRGAWGEHLLDAADDLRAGLVSEDGHGDPGGYSPAISTAEDLTNARGVCVAAAWKCAGSFAS